MQANILHDRPDDGQTTGFRREDVDQIGALSHIAKQTLTLTTFPLHNFAMASARAGRLHPQFCQKRDKVCYNSNVFRFVQVV